MTRLVRAAASAIASIALLVGLPWLLWTTIGNPLDHLPDLLAGDVNDHVVLAALAAVVYLAWAQFAVAFLVELVSAIRRTPIPRRIPGVFAGQQGLARALVTGALLLLPVTGSTLVPAAQAIALSPGHHPATAVATEMERPLVTHQQAVPTRDVTIGENDRTWWDLAVNHLGDGAAWRDLWELNQGRIQPDGTVLTSERVVLQPGWTVLVPDTNPATGPAADVEKDRGDIDVTVQPGDTLSELAAEHGLPGWTSTWNANAGRPEPDGDRFTDPDYIEPGWTVTIPAPVGDNGSSAPEMGDNGGDNHVEVSAGDTLSQIAADHRVALDDLVAANQGRVQADGSHLTDPDDIEPGWQIVIPGPLAQVVPAPTTPPGEVSVVVTPPAGPAPTPAQAAPVPAPPTTPVPSSLTAAHPDLAVGGPIPTPQATVGPTTGSQPPTDTPATKDDAGSVADQPQAAPWLAGVGLLAGGVLLALLRLRRRQFRHRSPGRSITTTPPELQETERALLSAGAGIGDVTFLDRALRDLTRSAADGHGHLPDVVAARLTVNALHLVLAGPDIEPPDPWQTDWAGTTWTLNRTLQDLPWAVSTDNYAPYPTLVSVGHTATGEQWLLDLERIGSLSLTGDPGRGLDLARFIAAELAHNTWSDTVDVILVGFGAEMTTLNPERLTHTDHLNDAVEEAKRAWTDALHDEEIDPRSLLDVRSRPASGEVPTPHVTLIAPSPQDSDRLQPLLSEIGNHPGRAAVAVIHVDGDDASTAAEPGGDSSRRDWTVRLDADGTLSVPALGVTITAEQLPAREAADLAALIALAAVTDDHPMPPSRGDQSWDDYADAAGSPLPQLVGPTTQSGDAEELEPSADVASSALPLPPRAYLDRTAADPAELTNLAPRVPPEIRDRVEKSDTALDVDLADWYDDTTTRPRITVLGPIQVRAQGDLPAGRPRLAWHTEVVTYLATRPRGATVEEFGVALWPEEADITSKPKLRNSIYVARKWLGTDPATGRDYLPSNSRTGHGAYRITGGLLDADLFRRLRLRGAVRGEDGIPDLQAALDLVTGAPFARQRPGGYGWLIDPALDHEYSAAIVDVAHLVATHHLAADEPALAAAAAQVALLADCGADTPLLDLLAASEALGNTAEADAYVKRIMANHDAEVEEDLPPRTAAILRRRRWLPPAA